MLNQTKSMLASRGVWGGATALLAGLAGLLGYTVSPADQVSLVNLATDLAAAVGGTSLDALRVGFKTEFQTGLGMTAPLNDKIAMTIKSSTTENRYGWLAQMPGMREWIGARVIQNIAKEREALAYLAAPTVDLASYPLLAAEVGVPAPTRWELAQLWANVAVYWRGLAAQIEGARMRAIAQVEASREPATVTATVRRFHPL